jgi:hypothetical protein
MGLSFDDVIAQFIKDNDRKPAVWELLQLFNNASYKDLYRDPLSSTEVSLMNNYGIIPTSAADVAVDETMAAAALDASPNAKKYDAYAYYARFNNRREIAIKLKHADPAMGVYSKMFGKTLLALSPVALAASGVAQYTSSNDPVEQAEGVLDAASGGTPFLMKLMSAPAVQATVRTTAAEVEAQGMIAARARAQAQAPVFEWNAILSNRYGAQNVATAGYPITKYINGPNALRRVAIEAQSAVGAVAHDNRTVAIARVRLNDGSTTYYASGNGARLDPIQREILSKYGVPEANMLTGAKYGKGYTSLENHAERVILRNLPKGANIEEWGISWASKEKPVPCGNCQPFVEAGGGALQLGR